MQKIILEKQDYQGKLMSIPLAHREQKHMVNRSECMDAREPKIKYVVEYDDKIEWHKKYKN